MDGQYSRIRATSTSADFGGGNFNVPSCETQVSSENDNVISFAFAIYGDFNSSGFFISGLFGALSFPW